MDTDETGRAGYVIEKSLFYAAHFIDGLPKQFKSLSDRADMVKILRHRLGERYEEAAERHGRALEEATGRPFDADADHL